MRKGNGIKPLPQDIAFRIKKKTSGNSGGQHKTTTTVSHGKGEFREGLCSQRTAMALIRVSSVGF